MADATDEVLDQEVEQTETTEAPAETDDQEVDATEADGQEEDSDQAEETETEEETADNAESTEEETENAEEETQDDQPDDPKEQARRAYEQRQQQREQRNYVHDQRLQIRQYQRELADKVRTGEIDELEQIKENQRIIQANQYVDQVERNRNSLLTDHSVAQAEIPLFNPTSPQYNSVLYERALNRFNNDYVVTDPETKEVLGAQDRYGNPVSLLQYLRQEAADMQDVLNSTQRLAHKAESKMRSKVVTPPSNGKVGSTGDELEDLLNKIGDVRLA